MAHDVGDLIISRATFSDPDGVLTDPTTVVFKFKDPAGNITTNAAPTNVSTGVYDAPIDIDEAGPWWWRWEATGNIQAAEEGSFKVDQSQFS